MSDIVVERRGQVLWLRLNRPERMNAYDRGAIDELIAALRAHADARATVITGTGRAFCAGDYLASWARRCSGPASSTSRGRSSACYSCGWSRSVCSRLKIRRSW